MRVIDLARTDWQRRGYGVGNVVFAPGGTLVAGVGRMDGQWCVNPAIYRRVNLRTFKVVSETRRDDPAQAWTLSGDGQYVLKARHGHESPVTVSAWRLWGKIGLRGWELAPWGDSCDWLATGPDGHLFAALTRGGMLEGVPWHTDLLRLTVPPDPRTFVLVEGAMSGIRVMNAISPSAGTFEVVGKVAARLLRPETTPAFSADSSRLAAWTIKGPALLLDTATAAVVHELPWNGPETDGRWHYRVALTPDGERVALWGGGQLTCQRCDGTGKPWKGKKPLGYVTDAVFLPDGQSLLAVDREGGTYRLDAESGKVLASWDWDIGMLLSVAVNADGSVAATGAFGGKLVLWDLD
jgi:WD40 repeat protein